MTQIHCASYREWLERPEGHDESVIPAHVRNHGRNCEQCAALCEAYRGEVTELRMRHSFTVSSAREDLFVARARDEFEKLRPLKSAIDWLVSAPPAWRLALPAIAAVALLSGWSGYVAWHQWHYGPALHPTRVAGSLAGLRAESSQQAARLPHGQRLAEPLRPSMSVAEKSVVQTSLGGRAVLVDPGVASVELGSSTRLHVEAWSAEQAALHLDAGLLSLEVAPRKARPPFEVSTPLALVQVVGTEFTVVHDPSVGTEVVVQEGEVRVLERESGQIVTLVAGERHLVAPSSSREASITKNPASESIDGPEGSAEMKGASQSGTAENGGEHHVALARQTLERRVPQPSATGASSRRAPEGPDATDARSTSFGETSLGNAQPVASRLPASAAPALPSSFVGARTPAREPREPNAVQREVNRSSTSAIANSAAHAPVAAKISGSAGGEDMTQEPEDALPVATSASLLKEARRLLAAGHDQQAERLLSGITTRSASEEAQRKRLLADAFVLQGKAEPALSGYAEAATMASGSSRASILADRARLLEKLGRSEHAATDWQQALLSQPAATDAAEAHAALGRLAQTSGRRAEAERHWEEILHRHSTSRHAPAALGALGRTWLESGRVAEARSLFQTHARQPNRGVAEVAWLGLARAELASGRIQQAREAVSEYETRFSGARSSKELERLKNALSSVETAQP